MIFERKGKENHQMSPIYAVTTIFKGIEISTINNKKVSVNNNSNKHANKCLILYNYILGF